MIGDQTDFIIRLRAVLPRRWFGDSTPVLDALLGGLAAAWSQLYAFTLQVRSQTRLMTASGVWLDAAAIDFLGARFPRRDSETDDQYRPRVLRELVRARGTRQAVQSAVCNLVGRDPLIFEPAHCGDTGSYGSASTSASSGWGGLAYGAAGGWGSLAMPFQFLLTASRPVGNGIAGLPGWCASAAGYCSGSISYASLTMVDTGISDADIYRCVLDVLPIGVTAWVRLQS